MWFIYSLVLLSQGNHSHFCGGILGGMCQNQPVHCQTSLWPIPVRFPSSPITIAPPGREKTQTRTISFGSFHSSSTISFACKLGVHGLCSCQVGAPKPPSCSYSLCADRHGSTNMVKENMRKIALKTGIKLPWKGRGDVLDGDHGVTGMDEGWRQQLQQRWNARWWWVEEKISRRSSALDGKLERKILISIWRSLIAQAGSPVVSYTPFFANLLALLS